MYSIQTDSDGEIDAVKSLKKAHDIAQKESADRSITVYIAKVCGGDTGDVDVARYENGIKKGGR